MRGGAGLLAAATEAARRHDLAGLAALVDWQLSGAATVGRSLEAIRRPDRAEAVASGLAELDDVAARPELVTDLLRQVGLAFARSASAHPADPETAESVLATLRLPEALPTGLTEPQVARLTELNRRAAGLRQVWLVSGDDHETLAVAWAPDTDRLVLALDWPGEAPAAG